MTEKRISESINVRINVGNFQHIQITKYAEKTITYESAEEMVKKEDELTEELLANLIRNMKTIPSRLGKTTNAVVEVEESIIKVIPEWLEESPIPNLAKDVHEKYVDEQKEEKDSAVEPEVKEEAPAKAPEAQAAPVEPPVTTPSTSTELEDFDDLFDEEDPLSK